MALRVNDSVHWYMGDMTSRIVAESGNPADRYHLGKIIMQSLKEDPDFVLQIDGATGKSETSGSVLERTVRCARSLQKLGFRKGDVMILMAPNHLDVAIPLYAALYLGIIVTAVDRTLFAHEVQQIFAITKPKIIFCQGDLASNLEEILFTLNLDTHLVSFDENDYYYSFSKFVNKCDDDAPIEEFKCTDLDPEETVAFLITTSGTTGKPKSVAHSHKFFSITLPYVWVRYTKFPTPTRLVMVGTSMQWSTALTSFIRSPILRYTRLQSSLVVSQEHAYYLINKYRPTYAIMSPPTLWSLLKPEFRHKCDFTCFEQLMLVGNYVSHELIELAKTVTPNTEVLNIFGMSELAGLGFYGDIPAPGSCGKPLGCFQYRLIDVDTQKEIYESNVPGELWVKGPCPFMGYYNNVEANKETYTKDGWLKTGDVFYRDDYLNYFYIDRIKLQMKGYNITMSPIEIEGVIRRHPGVLDVAVTSIPHKVLGDLPVACIVPQPGAKPTAEEIKKLVKDSLEHEKRLSGGVIFIDSMPMTATTKIHRRKLKQMALELPRA